MNIQYRKQFRDCLRKRQGAVTVEFIAILPLVLLMCLVVWQFVVAGSAVMETESMLKEQVRVAATSGNMKKAEKGGYQRFQSTGSYRLHSLHIKLHKEKVLAKAKAKIDLLFFPEKYAYTYSSATQTPVIQN